MKAARPSSTYPFVTRRQVVERLVRQPAFVHECITIIHRRYVDRDILPPPAGWMASHRKLGEELYAQLPNLNPSLTGVATNLTKRYAKQLAKVFRDEQLALDPKLRALAAIYGVQAPEHDDADDVDVIDPPIDIDDEPASHGDTEATPVEIPSPTTEQNAPTDLSVSPVPALRRRGRPKGSKNKAKNRPTKSSRKR
jgi:hypothetical protein